MFDSLFKKFDNIIVLDVETTGINARQDEIISLAALRVENRKGNAVVADKLDLLVRLSAGRRLPAMITELTGISETQLSRDGVSKEAACGRLEDLLNRPAPLIAAYNAQFDLCFLYYLLEREGKANLLKNAKMLDALTVYKDRRPYPHKLSDAVAAYSLRTQNTHRAIDDAEATLELMREMEKELDDFGHYINLFGYNPKYGVSGPRIASVRYVPQPYDMPGKLYER